nr:ATP-binding protein [Pseudoalteromonas sp. S16_S37]
MNASLEAQVEQRTLELALAKRRAEESSKVKSAFISSISHEMRTPLNGILGTLELVRREVVSQQQSNYLEMMSTSAKTLLSLINDVLDLSKIEAGKLEIDSQPFNPIQLIEHVASSVGIKAQQKHLQYLLDLTDVRYLSLTGDAGRLKQILYNLISNAIKFTVKGGVYIHANTKDEGELVWLDVSIRDTGVGIAKQNYDRLFEAFSQETQNVSSEYGGTGLGLSICKQLCELMGGKIDFKSEKGTGSTFVFSIPYQRSDAKPLYLRPILSGKKIFLAAKTEQEEQYWKKVLSLFGAIICDLNHADFWLVDFGSELGQNLSTAANLDKKACFIFDPISDPTPPKYALATMSKPVAYIDVLAAFNKPDTLALFDLKDSSIKSQNFASKFSALKGQTVIVVDDNQINLEVAKGVLNGQSINSILVHSAQELLEKLNYLALEQSEVLAILMDCNMPIMDGYAATAAVRAGEGSELYKSIPIIALTASAMDGAEERCKSVGMDDYVTKPIDAQKLFNILMKYVDDASPSNEEDEREPIQASQYNASEFNDDEMDANIPSLDSEAALARLMNDESLYTKICELFKESANARFIEMTDAIEQVDHDKIKQAAHALKGQAGDVGAKRLHYLTNKLEIAAKDEAQSNIHRMIYSEIQLELERVYRAIDSQVLNAAS